MCSTRKRSFAVALGFASVSAAALWAAWIANHDFARSPMDSARATTEVTSTMRRPAVTILGMLHLVGLRLLIDGLPGKAAFTSKTKMQPLCRRVQTLKKNARCWVRTSDFLRVKQAL